jgi:hypothetical protein
LFSSQPASPLFGARIFSPRAAETIRGLTGLIQQAKNLFHSQQLGIYQEVLAQVFRGKFGMAPAEVRENLNPLAGIQQGTTD